MTDVKAGIGIDLRHLRYFVAVAEELHFGRAARRLHISQPPLSQQIQYLERELGVKLLTRDSHSVRLTPAGSALLLEAPKVLAGVDGLGNLVRSVGDEPAGPLRIGYIGPTASAVNSRILRVIVDRYPGVVPELDEMSSSRQIAAVRAGVLDVGLIWETAESRVALRALHRLSLYQDSVSIGMARTNPLTSSSVVTFEQIAKHRFVQFRRDMNPEIHDAVMKAFRLHRISPSILYTDGNGHLDLVAAGFGICAVPSKLLFPLSSDIVVRPLRDPLLTFRLVMIWLRDNKLGVLERFVSAARELKESGQLG
jgi:DNA-binding transcriptional LysR family regulator